MIQATFYLPQHLVTATGRVSHSVSAGVNDALTLLLSDPAAAIKTALDHRASTNPFAPDMRRFNVYIEDDKAEGVATLAGWMDLSPAQLTSIALEHHLLTLGKFPEHDGHVYQPKRPSPAQALTLTLTPDQLTAVEKLGSNRSRALNSALRRVVEDHTSVSKALIKALEVKKCPESAQSPLKRVSFKVTPVHFQDINTISDHLGLSVSQMIRLQLPA